MESKICIKCETLKTTDEFHKNRGGLYGVHSMCKVCKNIYKKKYKHDNKEKRMLYKKKNKHIYTWRTILKDSIKRMKTSKNGKTIDLLGYSAIELRGHILALFTEGMTWDNHGEWHVDHIKPVSSFPRDTPVSEVNALSNLQPLWATTREINGVIYEGNLNKGS